MNGSKNTTSIGCPAVLEDVGTRERIVRTRDPPMSREGYHIMLKSREGSAEGQRGLLRVRGSSEGQGKSAENQG